MTIQVHGASTRSRRAFASCPFVSGSTMLKALALSLLLTAFLVASASGQTNWKLVWSDEFNGPQGAAPDPTKWVYKTVPGSFPKCLLHFCSRGWFHSPPKVVASGLTI